MTKLFSCISSFSGRFYSWLFASSSNGGLEYQCRRQFIARRVQCRRKNLTIREANEQKTAPYTRIVLKNGRGNIAQPISEKRALKSDYPKNNLPIEYKIGIGDTVTFSPD